MNITAIKVTHGGKAPSWQNGDVIEGGPFRQKNNTARVPEGHGLGVTLDTKSMKHWAKHIVDHGPMNHFHDPAMPGRYRKLLFN